MKKIIHSVLKTKEVQTTTARLEHFVSCLEYFEQIYFWQSVHELISISSWKVIDRLAGNNPPTVFIFTTSVKFVQFAQIWIMKLKLSQWGVSTGLRKTKVGEAAAPPCMLGSREGSCCRSSLQNFIKISPPSPPCHLCSVFRKDFFRMNKETLASQKSVNTKINWRDFSTETRKKGWQGSWYIFSSFYLLQISFTDLLISFIQWFQQLFNFAKIFESAKFSFFALVCPPPPQSEYHTAVTLNKSTGSPRPL